jgi:hypothetical protein
LELLQLPSSTKSLPEWQEDFLNGIVLENIDEQERAMNVDTFVAQIYLEFLASCSLYRQAQEEYLQMKCRSFSRKDLKKHSDQLSSSQIWHHSHHSWVVIHVTAQTALNNSKSLSFPYFQTKTSLPFYQWKPKLQSHQIRFKKLIDLLSFSQANYFFLSLVSLF